MKITRNNTTISLAGAILITVALFWQFFIKGLYPIPANFMLAWYEPWKSNFSVNNSITISHKPIAEDVFRQLYPFKILAIDLMKNNELPLWNSYNGAGMPLLATMHIGALSPFNIFFLLTSSPLAWSLQVIIQPFLIFISTYLFCKKLKLGTFASLFSSTIYATSGFVIARIIYNEYIFALSALPILLYLIEDYFQSYSRKILFLPLVLLVLFLSSHPHPVMYVLLFSGIYCAYLIYSNPDKIRSFILFSCLSVLGVGLSAIQLIPTIELLQNSNINNTTSNFILSKFLLPVQHLISIVVPNYYGNQATYNFWGFYDYIETVGYVGSVPLLFSIYGIIEKRNRTQLFLLSSALITLLLTIKLPFVEFLYTLPIPLFSTSAPSRILMLTTFCISILAGYGFNYWMSHEKPLLSRIKYSAPALLIMLLIVITTIHLYITGVSCNNPVITECRSIALRNTLFEFLALIVAYLILVGSPQRFKRTIGHSIVLSVVLVFGIYNGHKFLPFTQKEYVMPSSPLIENLRSIAKNSRVFGLGAANLKTDFSTYYQLLDPNYYDPLYNRRYGELVGYANQTDSLPRSDIEIVSAPQVSPEQKVLRDKLFSLLSIQYLFFSKKEALLIDPSYKSVWNNDAWIIAENTNVLPRAYVVKNIEVYQQNQDILQRMFSKNFSEKTTAITEEPVMLSKTTNIDPEITGVHIVQTKATNVTLSTSLSTEGFLILTDNYYPGWKAFIDGREVKIYRTNYTFRGVVVPAGEHAVRFSYEPQSFKIGAYISTTTLLIYLLVVFWPKIRSQKYHR